MQQYTSKLNWYKFAQICVFVFALTFASQVLAIENGVVDYGDSPIVDTDLDGLTDKGEEQIYHTNPRLPDTDGDGFYDGLEVLMQTDPLVAAGAQVDEAQVHSKPDPLVWWLSRITGLIAYGLLVIVVFLGFSFRTPILRKIVAPAYKLDLHKFLALLATAFVIAHVGTLLFDDYLQFDALDALIPFHANTQIVDVGAVAAGIVALYGIVILVATSLISRKYFPYGLWRTLHFIHAIVYLLVVIHILQIGTDVADGMARAAFLTTVVITGIMYPIGLFYLIRDMWRIHRRKKETMV